MDITLLFAGVVVSAVVQAVKKYFGTDSLGSMIAVVVLSLAVGGVMWELKRAGLWDSVLQVFVSAGAVYAFIFKNWQDFQSTPSVQ